MNPAGVGSTGCTGSANYSANQRVYAPVSGSLYQVSATYGGVCINTPGGRSVYWGHLINRRANGAVSAGTQIGTVALGRAGSTTAATPTSTCRHTRGRGMWVRTESPVPLRKLDADPQRSRHDGTTERLTNGGGPAFYR